MDELYDLTPEDILLDKEAEEIKDASNELIQKPDSDLDLLDGMQDSDLDQIEDTEDIEDDDDIEDDTDIYDDEDDDEFIDYEVNGETEEDDDNEITGKIIDDIEGNNDDTEDDIYDEDDMYL